MNENNVSSKSTRLKVFWRQHGIRIACILLIVILLFASKYLYIYV